MNVAVHDQVAAAQEDFNREFNWLYTSLIGKWGDDDSTRWKLWIARGACAKELARLAGILADSHYALLELEDEN